MKFSQRTLKFIAPALGLVAFVGTTAFMLGPVRTWIESPAASVSDDGAFRFRFPAGDVYTYDFTFESDQVLAAPRKGGTPIDGSLALSGELRLRSYGAVDGKYRLGVSLPRLDKHQLRFQGEDVLDQAEADRTFGEREAFVEVTHRGEITTVWFEKNAPPTFRSVMETVIPAIAVVAPESNDTMWSAEEPTPLGKAQTFYVSDGSPLTARRNRASYSGLRAFAMAPAPGTTDLTSDGSVELSEAGHLESLTTEESITVKDGDPDPRFTASLNVSLRKKSVTRFDAHAIAFTKGRFEEVKPGEVLSGEQLTRKMWQDMVGEMTLSDVEQGIASYALSGLSPQEGWMTRAVLLLRLNPAYAARLADLFQDPGTNANGRAFICDMLASAGNPEAQAAMRDALSSDAARVDPERYPGLLQRFSFVKEPTPETMAFLDSVMSTSSGVDRLAAAHSLGAAAGHLRTTGGDYAPHNAKLIDNLKNAGSADERRAMVGSLGNVGAPENVPVLAEMTSDEHPEVRRAVARAMRKVDAPEARDVLFDLIGDTDLGVGEAALATLGDQTLGKEDLERLESSVTSAGFNPALDQQVVSLLSGEGKDEAARNRMLDAILARTSDARTAARVRMVRGSGG